MKEGRWTRWKDMRKVDLLENYLDFQSVLGLVLPKALNLVLMMVVLTDARKAPHSGFWMVVQ